MKSKQRWSLFLLIAITMGSLLNRVNPSSAAISLITNSDHHWEVDLGDILGFKVEDNLAGKRYMGFQVNASYQSPLPNLQMGDVLNLSVLTYDKVSAQMVPSRTNMSLYTRTTSPSRIFGSTIASVYDGNSHYIGFFATPILPNNGTHELNLTLWGITMTELNRTQGYWNYNLYGGILDLPEFEVDGNELKLYNTTSGYYCNMTFDTNGILVSAAIRVEVNYGGLHNLTQTITREMDLSKLNPILETHLNATVNDEIIFKVGYPGFGWSFYNYIITADWITYNNLDTAQKVVNATRRTWNQIDLTWDVDSAWVNELIGGGNDFNQFTSLMDGPTNLIYPNGTTGADLNESLAPLYFSFTALNESAVGPYWLKLFNSTAYIYLELQENGIVANMTFNNGPQLQTWLASNISEVSSENLLDETLYDVLPGDELFYQFAEAGDITYGKYEIESFTTRMFDNMGSLVPAWIVNGTFYNWTTTHDWDMVEDPLTERLGTTILGVQNDEIICMDNGPGIVFANQTTGQVVNDSIGLLFTMFVFDIFEFDGDSWNISKSYNPLEWVNLSWNDFGIVTYMSLNFTNTFEGVIQNLTMSLITPADLPGNNLPSVDFTFVVNNDTVVFTTIITCLDSPFSSWWSFGDGDISLGDTDCSHQYTVSGIWQVRFGIQDKNGDIVEVTKQVSVLFDYVPIADFTFSIVNDTVTFDSTVSGGDPPYTYAWIFGDGNGASNPDPTHVYITSGTYTVILTVTDADGDTDIVQYSVTVNIQFPTTPEPEPQPEPEPEPESKIDGYTPGLFMVLGLLSTTLMIFKKKTQN